jgi:hypothetical protein
MWTGGGSGFSWSVDRILNDRLWDLDPIKLYDQMIAEIGTDEADFIWDQACKEYDRRNDDNDD